MDTKYSRMGKNTLLVIVGTAGSKFLSFLMLPFYTKWLPVADFGTVDIINIYASFLLSLATCSIAEAVFVFPKGQEKEEQIKFFTSGIHFIFFSFIFLFFILFAVKFVCGLLDISNSFINNIWLIYGILTTSAIQQYAQQFSRSIDKIEVYSISGIILTATTIIFSFILIPRHGVLGYVLALCLAPLVTAAYTLAASGATKFYRPQMGNMKSCRKMLKYSIPLVPNTMMWWLVGSLNRPVMEAFVGIEAIGLYAIAHRFPSVITSAFSMFAISWQISVLEEFGKPGYTVFFNKVFRWVVFLMILLSCVLSVFSSLIIDILVDSRYYESWRYIPVLTLSSVYMSISGFAGSNFSATKESKYFFYSSVWGALTAILANLILIPTIGIMGAAISVVLSFIVMSFSRCYYCWKYVKIEKIVRIAICLVLNLLVVLEVLCVQIIILKSLLLLVTFLLIVLVNVDIFKEALKHFENEKNINIFSKVL